MKGDDPDRLAAGEDEARRAFYERHFPWVYRFVRSRLGSDHGLVEEVVADVFFHAFRDIGQYSRERPLEAWLRGIAANRVRDRLRREGRQVELPLSMEGSLAPAIEEIESRDLPEEAAISRELADRVEAVLSAMPSRWQEALSLRYREGCSVREVAERMELSEKAAESLVARARRAFGEAFRHQASGRS